MDGYSIERIVYCPHENIIYDLKYDLTLDAIVSHLPVEYIKEFNPNTFLKAWIR